MAAKKTRVTKGSSKKKASASKKVSKKSRPKKVSKKAAKKVSKKAAAKKKSSKKVVDKGWVASEVTKKPASKKKSSKKPTSKKKSSKKPAASEPAPKKKASKQAGAKKTPARKATKAASSGPKQKPLPKLESNAVAAPLVPSVKDAAASVDLSEGTQVPAFSLTDQAGNPHSLADYLGAPFVLYFYPKDDTPGCTKEACGFNDELSQFEGLGMRVIGVSPDSSSSHARFAEKYGLSFTLLADPDKELSQAMGVYQLKKNYGREYMGIVRSTFLVGADGRVEKAWRGVRVAGHVPEVLERARQL